MIFSVTGIRSMSCWRRLVILTIDLPNDDDNDDYNDDDNDNDDDRITIIR